MSQDESRGANEPPEHTVIAYHERTKHHFNRYAASLGYMDWATQPNPFRRFTGADLFALPLPEPGDPVLYDAVFGEAALPRRPLTIATLSRFLRYALSITAWKSIGANAWALRANPSSGNLHPTEGYVVLPALDGLAASAAIYHYAVRVHALECRGRLEDSARAALFDGLPADTFLVGLSSIHWREAWKYGERAFRYCQHDVGHALAGPRIAAAAMGWQLTLLAHVPSSRVASTLGLERDEDFLGAEREEPDLLAMVTTQTGGLSFDAWTPPLWGNAVHWTGCANALSAAHGVDWQVIEDVARATTLAERRDHRDGGEGGLVERGVTALAEAPRPVTLENVVLTRRSAVSMDGITRMSLSALCLMLSRVLPTAGGGAVPWDALPWRPRIHLLLFVHRVDGLQPGLYMLLRDDSRREALRAAMRDDFQWEAVESAPEGLPLLLLAAGDCRALAARVSCGQAIAGDGTFSVGMLADFTESLAQYGASFYRNLFWECGMIGQVLYLEAEAAGLRATGIGCFFDDAVREVCGMTNSDWQSLYHFTVGGPIEDTRLSTLPAYPTEGD